ncbi:MAG: hypothetical protein WD942_08840 [Dehalococcoidia bacterium]
MEGDFDVGRIRLSDRGMPGHHWHTSSLLHLVAQACVQSPWVVAGFIGWGDSYKRHVAVTSAAARLSERGFDIETVVRGGLGQSFVGTVVAAACRAATEMLVDGADSIPRAPRQLGTWLLDAAPSPLDEIDQHSLFSRVVGDPEFRDFTGRVGAYVTSGASRAADILCWRLPGDEEWDALRPETVRLDDDAVWLRDRFLSTYLDEWATKSLHREYRYSLGRLSGPVPPSEMGKRKVPVQVLESQIARRHVLEEGPGTGGFAPLQDEALSLLHEGNIEAATGLFQGALYSSPDSPRLQNNLAFCLIPTQPEQAAVILESLHRKGFERELTAANLATAAVVRGDPEGARRWANEVGGSLSGEQSYYLWDLGTEPAKVVYVEDVRGHIHALVASLGDP